MGKGFGVLQRFGKAGMCGLCVGLVSLFSSIDVATARFVQLVELEKNPGPLGCVPPARTLDWGETLAFGNKPPNAVGLIVYQVRGKKGIDQYSIAWWEEPKFNPTTGEWHVPIFAQNLLSRKGGVDPFGITAYAKPLGNAGSGGIVAEVELGPPGNRRQAAGSAVIDTKSIFFKKKGGYELRFASCKENFVARYIFRDPNSGR